MRRIAFVLGLALLLPACGLSAAGVDRGQGSPAPPPSTVATTSPTSQAPATAAPPTTVAPPLQAPGTKVAATGPMEVVPYFFIDETGRSNRTGPFLAPVAREVSSTSGVARAAMEELLSGPSADELESVPALSSAIPEGVELLGLTIDNGLAEVDLSSEFEIEDDSAAMTSRAAQVVFTLTRFDSVERVRFLLEGEEVKVPTADGSLVGGGVTRGDYLDLAAAISVESPTYGAVVSDKVRVTGFAAVFEASFRYALTDDDGLIIEEGVAMTSNGMGWGSFDFTIDHDVEASERGALIVWAHSPEDGSQIDVREYPLILEP